MPHLRIEYSPGLFEDGDLAETLKDLNLTLVASGAIKVESDLKSRIVPLETIRVGTNPGPRGFLYAQLRVLPGRTPEMRAALSERIAAVLKGRCRRPAGMMVQLSVEIVEMERESYVKEVL